MDSAAAAVVVVVVVVAGGGGDVEVPLNMASTKKEKIQLARPNSARYEWYRVKSAEG